MPSLIRKALVLAKRETTEGVLSTPAVASDSLLVSNLSVNVRGEIVKRDIYKSNLSSLGHVVGIYWGEVGFSTEMRGIGVQATAEGGSNPLRENPLFCAVGLSPDFTVAASPNWKPKTDWGAINNSATIYTYLDGLLHVFLGCRGNLTGEARVGQYGKLNWSMQAVMGVISASPGGSDAVRDAALPSVQASDFQAFSLKPPAVLGANLSIHSNTAMVAEGLTFDLGNQIVRRESMSAPNGIASFVLADRDVSGTINPEVVPRSQLDVFYKWLAGEEGDIGFKLAGAGAWNRAHVKMPKVQFREPNYGDRNGIRIWDLAFGANADSGGDDEFVYTLPNAA